MWSYSKIIFLWNSKGAQTLSSFHIDFVLEKECGPVRLLPHTFMLQIISQKSIIHCVFYITKEMQLIQYSLLLSALYMFRAVFPPIIRSL